MAKTASIDLLAPRYEVIADYPLGEYGKGIIIEMCKTNSGTWVSTRNIAKWLPDVLTIDMANKCPAIFRKLQWWEKRKVDQMPEYVKKDPQSEMKTLLAYYKVKEWFSESFLTEFNTIVHVTHVIPATEQEYFTQTYPDKGI